MLSEDMLKSGKYVGVQEIFTHFQNAEVLTIIQITDIHYDPMYMPNGNAKCGEPMCCRRSQGKPENPDIAAGYWGDYRSCDIPWQAVQNTLHQIKGSHEVNIAIAIALLSAQRWALQYHLSIPSTIMYCCHLLCLFIMTEQQVLAFYLYMDSFLNC
jgi:hypothetical protein